MGKLELIKPQEQENEHVAAYKRVFPGSRPSLFQLDLIEGTVKESRAWEQALVYWAANDYRPQSIGKIIDYHNQILNGTVQRFDDRSKVQMQVGRTVETKPEPLTEPCWFCHKIECTESHWGETR